MQDQWLNLLSDVAGLMRLGNFREERFFKEILSSVSINFLSGKLRFWPLNQSIYNYSKNKNQGCCVNQFLSITCLLRPGKIWTTMPIT